MRAHGLRAVVFPFMPSGMMLAGLMVAAPALAGHVLVSNVPVPFAVNVAVSPDSSRVFVTKHSGGYVVIDAEDPNIVTHLSCPALAPVGIVFSEDGTQVFLADNATDGTYPNYVYVLDPNYPYGNDPNDAIDMGYGSLNLMATSPTSSDVYVTSSRFDAVCVFDALTHVVSPSIPMGSGAHPVGIAVSPDGTEVYVANRDAGTLSIVDAADPNNITSVNLGGVPRYVAVKPDGTRVYVSNSAGSNVWVVDPNTGAMLPGEEIVIPGGGALFGLAVNPDVHGAEYLYVAGRADNALYVVDTATGAVVETIAVGFGPEGVAVSPDGHRVYLSCYAGHVVSIVDVRQPLSVSLLDIRPGSCPNPLNRNSQGVLPVAITGTQDLDVLTIDANSLVLSREGVEGGAAPVKVRIADVATPFEGELCECHELAGDGVLDLAVKFSTQEVVEALDLNSLSPGEEVVLTVTGTTIDGKSFTGSDCVWLVPPQTLTVSIRNEKSGEVELDPAPIDPNLSQYPLDTSVTLTAHGIGGEELIYWQIYDPNYPGDANHAKFDSNNPITIVMMDDREVTAAFTRCGGSAEPLLPMMLIALGLFALLRRRA